MAHSDRLEEIAQILSIRRKASVQELTKRLNVSEATMRKDLTLLEEMGLLVRTHGGAILAEDRTRDIPLVCRAVDKLEVKRSIALRARELIGEGETIFIDSGSTCLQLAAVITDMHLRVVCHSMEAMAELMHAAGISLICLGGNYRKDAGSFIGPLSVRNVSEMRIETCFVGAAGVTADETFYSQNIIEADLKAAVLKNSTRRIVLADGSKLGRSAFAVFAKKGDVDLLITDSTKENEEFLRNLELEYITTNPETAR